ncbi:CSN-associated deubiquitinating enzyme Ubp12 [Steccherinum ochraceum]|uniref:ubiquitinyl hydrolase 1 n=1 Tax=Steccherinum ochraceum TaxID=92696 RepID=A0A4R0RSL8_9APHY|nr:CSN-associated deubiquitinating enzyme Ubp12 [Steccherinum ochraceum]
MDSQPSSSSKRSISVDPSQESQPSYDLASLSVSDATLAADIDAYMADQGEASIPATLDVPTQSAQDNDIATSGLSGEQKLELIDSHCKVPMVPGTTWYLVSRRWYKRWRKACTGEVDKEGGVTEAELGPVDNSVLVDAAGILVSPPVERVDVEYIPAQAWSYFEDWYGKAQWPLPRRVITRGIMNEPGLEVMPPRFKVHIVTQASTNRDLAPVNVVLSTKDTVSTLIDSLVDALQQYGSRHPTRIWKLHTDTEGADQWSLDVPVADVKDKVDFFNENPRKTLEDALLESGDVFIVEYLAGSGPIMPNPDRDSQAEVSGASTPQSTASATPASGRLFGPSNFFDQMQTQSRQPSTSTDLVKADNSVLRPAALIKSNFVPRARSVKHEPGTLGLSNMGNTCFMNSAIQCLAHTQELMDYFLLGVFEEELNPENPLGMQGAIAQAFGSLSSKIWDGSGTSYSPRDFKAVLQRFAPQFGGYQQHDSQELVAFLLDGLHEDLNRVKKKPYVEKPDWEGGGDKELVALARESWEGYMKRNDSVIVDLFQGQYQSTLVCPECEKVSITFDPFMYLTLPLPIKKTWTHDVYYVPWDADKPHVKVSVELNRDASFKEVRQTLGRWMDANPEHLLTLEIFSNRFYKDLNDHVTWGEMTDNDVFVCYELPGPSLQSRSHKRQEDDPYVIPVFLSDAIRPARTFGNNSFFGYPFIIWLDQKDACDEEAMYNLILSRLERWTGNARELSRWEAGSPTDSLEEVPIPLSSDAPADSTVEINENGDVIPVEDSYPEEGDIVDQKDTVIRESQDEVLDEEPVELKFGSPRKLGFKKDIFQLHIYTHEKPYGENFSLGLKSGVSWETRREEAKDQDPPVLVRPNDVFVCEFDSHMKEFYFLEHKQWDKWDEFEHPELKANREAARSAKKRSISLQDCLDEFTKEEQLGEDDLWYCPRCKKHQQATKRFDLWKVPDVLVVHLKRFSSSRTLRDKIDAFVDFPVEGLDLTPMVGERRVATRLAEEGVDIQSLGLEDTDEPLMYDLYAVDEHLGGLGGGHYRAFAHNHVTDKWYHFDDSHVSPSSANYAVNSNAYLLFYKRRTTRPLGGKSHEKIEAARQHPKATTSDAAMEDTQLPTPPSEPMRPLISLPRSHHDDADVGWSTPPDTRSSSASRGSSSPPPLDDVDPPSFDDSALDPLILATHRFDMPDPLPSPSLPSPSSSNEAEMDSDGPDDRASNSNPNSPPSQRAGLWSVRPGPHPRRVPDLDDEMD